MTEQSVLEFFLIACSDVDSTAQYFDGGHVLFEVTLPISRKVRIVDLVCETSRVFYVFEGMCRNAALAAVSVKVSSTVNQLLLRNVSESLILQQNV